jgi:GNAT superfamily N-acetyltransferase
MELPNHDNILTRLRDELHIDPRFILHYNAVSWGFSIMIMEKSGKAFGRISRYYNNETAVYLDSLSVDAEIRRRGVATGLQEIRENIGRSLGATVSCLWVEKNTWMHDWYKRRGYEDWIPHEHEENSIWMKKSLY